MNKNLKMLKVFFRVLKNNNEEIKRVLPNMYTKSFYDIDFNYLLEHGIKYLVIDIDGTILPPDIILVNQELINKITELKENFSIYLVSNNNLNRVKPVADILDVAYLNNASKPLPVAYQKIFKLLGEDNPSKIAMIGDQMLSDIYGANAYNIYTVLVRPISNHNNIGTYINRKLQNKIEKYLKVKNYFDKDKYYKNRDEI